VTEKISPQTYIDMNEEFIKDDIPFRIEIPTQEALDKWQNATPTHHPPVHSGDMVAEMWVEHNKREEMKKNGIKFPNRKAVQVIADELDGEVQYTTVVNSRGEVSKRIIITYNDGA
tara:strand:+ start:3390 stop:3737 length:348 start_codon:yes stop_codon:yes gene_type:complete